VTAEGLGTYRAGPYEGSTMDRQMVKSCLSLAIMTGGRIDQPGVVHKRQNMYSYVTAGTITPQPPQA
jgi:hypothetical protein